MAELYDLRKMPEDIKAGFRARGIDPDDTIIVDDPATNKTEFRSVKELGTKLGQTVLSEGAQTILPTAAGVGAGAGAVALGTALGMPVGGVPGTVAGLATALPAAVGGATLASKLQTSALKKFAPDLETEAQLLRMANPRAATLGQIGGGFIGGGANTLRGLMRLAGGSKATAAKIAAVPTAIGGGLEAYSEYTEEGEIDPLRVAAAAAAGPFQVKNNQLSQLAEDVGGYLGGGIGRAMKGTAGVKPADLPKQRTVAEASLDILKAHSAGQFTPDSPLYKQLAEELKQPHASPEALLSLAQKHVESNTQSNPDSRAELAANVWDALRVKNLPADTLASTPLEKRLAELVTDNTVGSREQLIELARKPNIELAILDFKRAVASTATPRTVPGQRMTDDEVQVLLKVSPDVEPPNASPLDKAILDGRKRGYINSIQDVRRLEDAYTMDPATLPAASRTIWMEKQAASGFENRAAEEAAEAFRRRDTEFFTKDFPKRVKSLQAKQKVLDEAEAIINDRTAPELTKAQWRSKAENAKKAVEQDWQDLLEAALSRYPATVDLSVGRPTGDFTMRRGKGPTYTGPKPSAPEVPPQSGPLQIESPLAPRGLLGYTKPPIVTPPPITPKGLLTWEGEQRPNPTDVRYGGLDPNQNIPKFLNWFFNPDEKNKISNFYNWFRGSKVSRPDGLPERMYHATATTEQFDDPKKGSGTFDVDISPSELGAHFGSSEASNEVASFRGGRQPARTIPVFLSIKNPLRMPDIFPLQFLDSGNYNRRVQKVLDTVQDPKARDAILEHLQSVQEGLDVTAKDLREALQKLGYDGVVYDNINEGGGDSWIVFDPKQVKSATGNSGDFDVNNPAIFHSGIPQHTAVLMVKAALFVPNQVLEFIHEGTIGPRPVWAGTISVLDRLKQAGPAGRKIADADFRIRHDATKTFNTAANAYVMAFDNLTPTETARVNRYLNEAFDNNGVSLIIPTAKEQAAIDLIRNQGLLYLVNNGIVRGGPGIREGALFREQQINPNYLPTITDSKVRKIMQRREKGWEQLAADWEAWYGQKLGLTPDEARNLMNEYLSATGPSSSTDAAKFGALTKSEGVGLPPSWRADPRTALMYHAFRASKNFAWFTHVQKDPQVAKLVGETDDGWGGVIDTSNVPLNGMELPPAAVEAWKKETNGHLIAAPDLADTLTRFATAFQLGPITAARDFIGTPAHLADLVPGEDFDKVFKALRNVMTSDVRADMEKAGAVRLRTAQPFEFNAASFSEGAVDKILELVRTVQGRNLLEATARQWAYETGRLVGAARLSKGDMGFFEKLEIPDWRNLKPDELFDAVGSRFVESAQGNYGAGGLPSYLLMAGSSQPWVRRVFSLQRWPVERFNNWYKRAWRPAVDRGEFRPLLKSVFGALLAGSALNMVQDYLQDQKPPEMTWKEFMRAENKEVAYTLFSKLQNVGFAGLLSNLGLNAVKLSAGEGIDMPVNLGWDLVAKGILRTMQAAEAMTNRGAGGLDVFKDFLDALAKDHIQAWRLFQNAHRPDLGNREERIYRRQTGQGSSLAASQASIMSNPMDPLRDFRQAATIEDTQKALPKLGRALQRNPNMEPRIQSPMRPLVSDVPGQPSYYDFVSQLQGADAGAAALSRDQQLHQLTLLKRQEVLRRKWEAQIASGPR